MIHKAACSVLLGRTNDTENEMNYEIFTEIFVKEFLQ